MHDKFGGRRTAETSTSSANVYYFFNLFYRRPVVSSCRVRARQYDQARHCQTRYFSIFFFCLSLYRTRGRGTTRNFSLSRLPTNTDKNQKTRDVLSRQYDNHFNISTTTRFRYTSHVHANIAMSCPIIQV